MSVAPGSKAFTELSMFDTGKRGQKKKVSSQKKLYSLKKPASQTIQNIENNLEGVEEKSTVVVHEAPESEANPDKSEVIHEVKQEEKEKVNEKVNEKANEKVNENKDEISDAKMAMLNQVTKGGNTSNNIRVLVRIRPVNEVEQELLQNGVGILCVDYMGDDLKNCKMVRIKNPNGSVSNPYLFDKVFPSDTPQHEIYDYFGKGIVKDVLSGYNGTIFAYGQSGSGKTYTMYGSDIYDENTKGVIPRLIQDIFENVERADENIMFQFKMSFMQIYKEVIYDLLTGEKDLKIKESPIKGIYVDKLTEVYISSFEEFMEYVELAQQNRIVGDTKLNHNSSRSHSILIFEVTQNVQNDNFTKTGKLNLVDLAGSEKVSKTGAVGETLEEAKKINLSLSSLGNVIHALTSNSEHIPYRDSKLTRILQESLGGNFKTSLIVTCSPHSYHLEETTSSMQFATRVKTIKNKVKMNVQLTYEELQKIIRQLRRKLDWSNKEIERLKALVPDEQKSPKKILSGDGDKLMITEDLSSVSICDDKNNNDTTLAALVSNKEDEQPGLVKTKKKDVFGVVGSKNSENNLPKVNISQSGIESPKKNNEFHKAKTLMIQEKKIDLEEKKDNEEKKEVKEVKERKPTKKEGDDLVTMLKKKLEMLNNEIKEKDMIISALEEKNRKGAEKFKEEKENGELSLTPNNPAPKLVLGGKFSRNEVNGVSLNCLNGKEVSSSDLSSRESGLNNIIGNKKNQKHDVRGEKKKVTFSQPKEKEKLTINNDNEEGFQKKQTNQKVLELYEEIKKKLQKIDDKYCGLQKEELNLEDFNRRTQKTLETLIKKCEVNLKNTFESSSNGHVLFFDSISEMLSKSLDVYTLDSQGEFTFNTIEDEYKTSIEKIFEEVFRMFPGQNQKERSMMIKFVSIFIFSFVDSYITNQLMSQMNLKLANESLVLRNSNNTLISIVDDLLKTNIDLFNNTKFTASILETGLFADGGEECLKSFVDQTSGIIPRGSTRKISTFINKKQMDVLKALRGHAIRGNIRGATTLLRVQPAISSTLLNIEEAKNPVAPKLSSQTINVAIQNTNGSNTNEPSERSSQNNFKNVGPQFPIRRTATIGDKQTKKLSKLGQIRQFVVKALKDNEKFKKDQESMKLQFKTLIKICERQIISKLIDGGILPKKELEYYDNEEIDEVSNFNAGARLSTNNNLNTIKELANEGSQEDVRMLIEDQSSGERLKTMGSGTKSAYEHRPTFYSNGSGNPFMKKHISYDLMNSNAFQNYLNGIKSSVGIETIVADYLETGTATRKFDGISVRTDHNKIRYWYNGGLNAQNTISTTPLQKKLPEPSGDNSFILYSDEEGKK